MCLFFHKWSDWEQYEERGVFVLGRLAPKNVQGQERPYRDIRQKRHCKKCNKQQDVLVREG